MKYQRLYQAVAAAFVVAFDCNAVSIEAVLDSVAGNNLELKALLEENKASVYEIKADNSLDATSVEYSPFWGKDGGGIASSELIVSQEFDFPTLYVGRNRLLSMQEDAARMEYLAARCNVLLQAKLQCLELVQLRKMRRILDERMDNGKKMLELYEKRLENGDATQLDVNRIRMELMDVSSEVARNETDMCQALSLLKTLNGNKDVDTDGFEYEVLCPMLSGEDVVGRILGEDAELRSAEASVAASRQAVSVSKQEWLPKITLGYRRNTEFKEAVDGFLVGASFPLFSSSKKVKAAKSRYEGAQLQLENARAKAGNEVKEQLSELARLRSLLDIYDMPLMEETLRLLTRSVELGEISVIEYYVEADKIYQKQQEFLLAESRYQKLHASVFKGRL